MTASVTHGRALRYAKGSARGLLHHVLGHCLPVQQFSDCDRRSRVPSPCVGFRSIAVTVQ